jgi:hypothetical protein
MSTHDNDLAGRPEEVDAARAEVRQQHDLSWVRNLRRRDLKALKLRSRDLTSLEQPPEPVL